MHRRVLFIAGAALFALAALPARADQWSKVYKVTGKPDVRVETNDASLEVNPTDAAQVTARVAWPWNAIASPTGWTCATRICGWPKRRA